MATLFYPPTTLPPLENDVAGRGKPSDHNILVVAPKAGSHFKQERRRRIIRIMPMPESSIEAFMRELGQHSWSDIYNEPDANVKTAIFHSTLARKLKRHFKEKHVKMSTLDKEWFTPALKQLLAEIRGEFFQN